MKRAEEDPMRCGGILADEMGMGKTLQAIHLIHSLRYQVKPTLVVVPKSLVDYWFDEIKSYGTLSVIKYAGPRRSLGSSMQMVNATDVYITTYDCVTIDFSERPNHRRGPSDIMALTGEAHTSPETPVEEDVKSADICDSISVTDGDSSFDIEDSDASSDSEKNTRNMILLTDVNWGRVVLDEAHRIRNQKTRRFKSIVGLNADFRWCLTGTPIQNRLSDLFSLVLFLEIFPFAYDRCMSCNDCSVFHLDKPRVQYLPICEACGCPIRKHSNVFKTLIKESHNCVLTAEIFEKLQRDVLSKILLRRTIADAELETTLPVLEQETVTIELSADEKRTYDMTEKQAQESFEELESIGAKYACYFAILVRLRLLVDHPLLVTHGTDYADCDVPFFDRIHEDEWFESSKIVHILSLINEVTREISNKCLVFSNFTRMLELISFGLFSRSIPFLQFDGRLSPERRRDVVENFHSDSTIQVLLISTQCGGEGLNLQGANIVILVDPWWNPALESQSIHRAYRIGQKRPVKIFRFVAKETIEERIVELQKKKQYLFDGAINNPQTSADGLTFNDMKFLIDMRTIE